MHERLRDKLLGKWGRHVTTHPRGTLAICLLLASVCVLLTASRLQFRADRSDLVDPSLPWNRRYAEYKKQFPRWGDVIVVVEGQADDPRVDALARRIGSELGKDPRVSAATAGFDVAQAGPKMFTLGPRDTFDQTLGRLSEARRLAAAANPNSALAVLLAGLRESESDKGGDGNTRLDELEGFLQPYLVGLDGGEPDFAFLNPRQSRWQPLVSDSGSGRLRFVRVQFSRDQSMAASIEDSLAWLRSIVKATVAASDLPAADWGVTGIPAIEADETSQSVHDATIASILAAALISLLMLIAFRGWVVPLLAIGSLLIGMAWSFGWLILSVGHLQVLSVVFTSILLGVGIDFALLFISRLELVREIHSDLPAATSRVFRGVGPGILTGALTTAAAFASTSLTSFTGMAEMGIIAAGGILLCVVAVLTTFPAALSLVRDWKQVVRHRPGGETAAFARGWLNVFDRRPAATLAATGLVLLAMLWLARGVQYDSNVLKLQSPGVESVAWERRVVDDDAQSVWAALVLTAPDKAADMVARLRALPLVSDVGGMGMLFPRDVEQRQAAIKTLREQPVKLDQAPDGLPTLLSQLHLVRLGLLKNAAGAVPQDIKARLKSIADRVQHATRQAAQLGADAAATRWDAINHAFLNARQDLQTWLADALSDRAAGPDDLPPALRSFWVGNDGSWLLQAYPAADPAGRDILDDALLGPFVNSIRTAAPLALGPAVQIYESGLLIVRAYKLAACYAIGVIFLLLLMDFRSLPDALSCMAPVTVGFVGAFGMMGAFGVSLNFANLIVMPLIFGLGMDASVNMVHRWRQEPFGRPAGLSGGTGRGITLAMVSTMIGFGSLLVSDHRGIRSLGFVILAGLGVTLAACYTTLPALLRLRTRPDMAQRETEEDEPAAVRVEPKPRAVSAAQVGAR